MESQLDSQGRSDSGTPREPVLRQTPLAAYGEPMIWLTGGALVLALLMVITLVGLLVWNGGQTFWPKQVVQFETALGEVVLGQIQRQETWTPDEDQFSLLEADERARVESALSQGGGVSQRVLVRDVPPYDDEGTRSFWVSDFELAREGSIPSWDDAVTRPEWALVVERYEGGRFFGVLEGFVEREQLVAETPQASWDEYQQRRPIVAKLRSAKRRIDRDEVGELSGRIERARLDVRSAALKEGESSHEWAAAKKAEAETVAVCQEQIAELLAEAGGLRDRGESFALRLRTADGKSVDVPLWDVVRAFAPNRMDAQEKLGTYLERWWEFVSADPRKANSEGGVFPAIFGTIAMTLIMVIVVVPFGVLAALYLREYAKQGVVVSLVRISVNNLAGVPSIVYGVFGLGFFCYIVGSGIDELLFSSRLPSPTFGTKGLLWASFTLALLTLPVVIVATEEALAAVPQSMREGSYACGATKWQTMRRIVLPRAMPGILTGMILAVARGAGEVAPLMMVGAVKYAPELPISSETPTFGLERNFMHLGFHIYDLGFKSPDSEAAIPMVYTTALLLLTLVIVLNFAGVWVRARLRRRFEVR